MNTIQIENFKKAIKTGELKKALAKEELKSNRIFTYKELKRAIEETGCDNITRNDINFEKTLLKDTEYNQLQIQLTTMLDSVQYIQEDKKEEYKEKILKVVNAKDDIYNNIRKDFY